MQIELNDNPLGELVKDIICVLQKLVNEYGDDDIVNAFKEAKEYYEVNYVDYNNYDSKLTFLEAHGLAGKQLALKKLIYKKIMDLKMPSQLQAWFDFVNSFLGSISDLVMPGVGAIKEIKDMLHIKIKYDI